jgi:colanic acid/amylovoran biosynthesis glycosyltransferase
MLFRPLSRGLRTRRPADVLVSPGASKSCVVVHEPSLSALLGNARRTAHVKVAYVVSRFPALSETFVLRELEMLAAQPDTEVVLCPLLLHREPVSHPRAIAWTERAWYTPFVSRTLVRDTVSLLARRPGAAAPSFEALASMARTPKLLMPTLAILPKAFHLARRMEASGVTHVHAHFATHPTTAAWLVHRLTGIPYSFTAHSYDIYVHTTMLREKLADASFVVAISEYHKTLLSRFGDRGKIHVIHCGIEPERYPLRQARPPGPFTILFVGNLRAYKGIEHLIRACALLRERGREFRCLIAGGGPLGRELGAVTTRLGLNGKLLFLGPRREDEIITLLQEAHVFVLPSVVERSGNTEGLPIVLMESLAVGVPVIATAVAGVPEIIRPGETGRLVRPADPIGLAVAIEEVMDEESNRFAERGRRLIESEFALRQSVSALRELLERTLPPS